MFSSPCSVAIIRGEGKSRYLSISYQKKKATSSRTTRGKNYDEGGEQESVMICLNRTIVNDLRCFLPSTYGDSTNEALDSADEKETDDEEEVFFVAFDLEPDDTPDFKKYSSAYLPKSNKEGCQYVVVQFASEVEIEELTRHLRLKITNIRLDWTKAKSYGKSLLKEIEKDRNIIHSQNRDPFVLGKLADEELLTFPFAGDPAKIEDIASEMNIAKTALLAGPLVQTGVDETKKAASESGDEASGDIKKAHYCTIRVEDFERLYPGEWLNDALIDFWMQW